METRRNEVELLPSTAWVAVPVDGRVFHGDPSQKLPAVGRFRVSPQGRDDPSQPGPSHAEQNQSLPRRSAQRPMPPPARDGLGALVI